MRTLSLTQKNIIDGTNNTQLQYNFPAGSIHLVEGDQLALASISMYNSVFNITSALGNNKFTYYWVDGAPFDVVFNDGFYDVDGMNDYMHQIMLNNKHYLVEVATGNFVWFITLQVDVTTYKIQFQTYPMTPGVYSLTANYTNPSTGSPTAWVIQTNTITPYVSIPNTYIQTTLGFTTGFYQSKTDGTENTITGVSPDKVQSQTYTTIQTNSSTIVPQITSLTSYIMTCSLINNNYSIPNTLLSAFPPSSAFAEQFVFSPNQLSFIDCQPGSYSSFNISLYDQNLRNIVILDPQIVVLLVIRSKNEKS